MTLIEMSQPPSAHLGLARNLACGHLEAGQEVTHPDVPKTNEAVRGFQQALGLSVDGIVGPLTWRALVSAMLAG
jgi:hypothetical protein